MDSHVLAAALSLSLAAALPAQKAFHDDFTGTKVLPQWTWTDPGKDCKFQIVPATHNLRMIVPPGNDHTTGHAAPLYAGSMLVVPGTGDFTITTHVNVNYPSFPAAMESGLMIWQNKSNNLQFKRTNAFNSQNVLFYGNIANARTTFHGQKTISAKSVYLRIVRTGNVFTSYYGTNGKTWLKGGSVTWKTTGTMMVGLSTSYWLWFGSGKTPATGDYGFFDYSPSVSTTLRADRAGFSAAAKTPIGLSLDRGAAQAGRVYLVLGSLSGSSPGLPLPGGATLPLKFDAMTNLMLLLPGTAGVFPGTVGLLNAQGKASAQVILPAGALLASKGGSLRFAAVVFPKGAGPWLASNAAVLGILP